MLAESPYLCTSSDALVSKPALAAFLAHIDECFFVCINPSVALVISDRESANYYIILEGF
jgi:hypothetical protein